MISLRAARPVHRVISRGGEAPGFRLRVIASKFVFGVESGGPGHGAFGFPGAICDVKAQDVRAVKGGFHVFFANRDVVGAVFFHEQAQGGAALIVGEARGDFSEDNHAFVRGREFVGYDLRAADNAEAHAVVFFEGIEFAAFGRAVKINAIGAAGCFFADETDRDAVAAVAGVHGEKTVLASVEEALLPGVVEEAVLAADFGVGVRGCYGGWSGGGEGGGAHLFDGLYESDAGRMI